MLDGILQQSSPNSDLVKRLAAFNPFIMLKRPIDTALRQFDLLYSTFLQRSFVSKANGASCRDEYIQLLDHHRTTYSVNFDNVSAELIEFLMGLRYLRDRGHLLHLFELYCLCATSSSNQNPVFSFGNVTTAGHQGWLSDVVLPSQSNLSGVSEAVSVCSRDDSRA